MVYCLLTVYLLTFSPNRCASIQEDPKKNTLVTRYRREKKKKGGAYTRSLRFVRRYVLIASDAYQMKNISQVPKRKTKKGISTRDFDVHPGKENPNPNRIVEDLESFLLIRSPYVLRDYY